MGALSEENKHRLFTRALLIPKHQITRSSVRLLKGKIAYNPDPKGEFICGVDPRCRKEHIIRLARIHRVHKNLRLYYCNRVDCSKALFKVDATGAKEEYRYVREKS